MLWPNNHRVIWVLSQSQYYNTHRQTLILCDCSDSPPGFTLLYLMSSSTHGLIRRACVRINKRDYVSGSKYRQVWCSISPDCIQHGPCVTSISYTCDQAYSLKCDFWPLSASSWIDRCHTWPQPHVVDDIVQNGCHFLAIRHKLGIHEDHEWRISFSLAEQKLLYAMNHCQALTYILLKLFLTEIINNGLSEDDKSLCSYHMKTAVFWVIQQNAIPHWCPQNLLGGFWVYEYTLISEARFDLNIMEQIYSTDIPSTPVQQSSMWYLHTIEQMIVSPLLTQYQVPLLQKHSANILQQTAFVLHMESYTQGNKMRFNVDEEMYTEAVGGHSWSTKMRQAVAWDITLDNKTSYIHELIPEQQSALQNTVRTLYIPSLVMLYMLEILCYRHIDTTRAQTALDDLQTLVHADQATPLHDSTPLHSTQLFTPSH
ncbi:uncharacterized protein LOC133174902 [Saccostrea echinata]|uniref:uncharacterized protein LOC133174902 n=1 Tax=Saccostrea echinata TaxID=191078 RepID=UPI002A81D0B5|nr:uncharacterized protein LOC133174902 [Saccostrea echinata]